MKLNELAVAQPTKQISKVFESHFNQRVHFDNLSPGQITSMLARVQSLLKEHRNSLSRHSSEQNPAYLKLMMMEQALTQRLGEEIAVVDANSPEMKKIQDKVKLKQQLTPDEQKKANALLALKAESNTGNFLKESEVQQAQVVLAAQDMVDNIQGMLEDTTEMQFKELPALVDSIKNQIGVDQAAQFNTDAQTALTGLVQNLQAAKQQLETALGVVTGQAATPVVPGDTELDTGLDNEPAPDLDTELDLDIDDEEEIKPAAALGRGRR